MIEKRYRWYQEMYRTFRGRWLESFLDFWEAEAAADEVRR